MLNSIASFLGYLMNFIYQVVQNYGLTIIIFTVLLKLVLLPFTIKQHKSMQKTQELQPLVQELQRKYGNDQQKFSEEYQKLLKEKNLNMMSGMGCSGCLIQLIQIPIILGMFYMMASPLTNILKLDTEEINKYREEINPIKIEEKLAELNQNASQYSEEEFEKMAAQIKETDFLDPQRNRYYQIEILNYTDLIDMNFFGLNLCDITMENKQNWVLWIIPILSAIATFTLTRMNAAQMNQTKQAKPEDKALKKVENEMPMPDMRVMNTMMIFMTGYIALVVPQGVGLYWVTSNIIGVIQQAFLKKNLPNTKKDV